MFQTVFFPLGLDIYIQNNITLIIILALAYIIYATSNEQGIRVKKWAQVRTYVTRYAYECTFKVKLSLCLTN
jgi:hypothetical protein